MMSSVRPIPLVTGLAIFLVVLAACSGSSPVDAASKKDAKSSGGDVAMIDGKPITSAQLNEKAEGALLKVRQEEYKVLQTALTVMINEQLLEKEAKSEGVERADLLKQEIDAKVSEPTEAELEQAYAQYRNQLRGRTREQSTPDLTRFLKSQKTEEIRRQYFQKLREKYKVKILLVPPRVDVAIGDDPFKGPEKAAVTIVEFSDYQCPYCRRVEPALKQVMENYEGKVRLVYKDYPLPMHPLAPKASEAALCAEEQGKFWEYHEALYADQSKLSVPDLEATATRLGLDSEKFNECLSSSRFAEAVQSDMADAQAAGVSSTPYFFINGIPLVGAQGYGAFADIIDQELSRETK